MVRHTATIETIPADPSLSSARVLYEKITRAVNPALEKLSPLNSAASQKQRALWGNFGDYFIHAYNYASLPLPCVDAHKAIIFEARAYVDAHANDFTAFQQSLTPASELLRIIPSNKELLENIQTLKKEIDFLCGKADARYAGLRGAPPPTPPAPPPPTSRPVSTIVQPVRAVAPTPAKPLFEVLRNDMHGFSKQLAAQLGKPEAAALPNMQWLTLLISDMAAHLDELKPNTDAASNEVVAAWYLRKIEAHTQTFKDCNRQLRCSGENAVADEIIGIASYLLINQKKDLARIQLG